MSLVTWHAFHHYLPQIVRGLSTGKVSRGSGEVPMPSSYVVNIVLVYVYYNEFILQIRITNYSPIYRLSTERLCEKKMMIVPCNLNKFEPKSIECYNYYQST